MACRIKDDSSRNWPRDIGLENPKLVKLTQRDVKFQLFLIMVQKVYVTYNEVHKLCQASADRILNDFQPNLMIAIGGGGYVPARILRYRYRFEAVASGITIPSLLIIRSFLKRPSAPNIPIQAIGLSLYEQLPSKDPSDPVETPGTKVTRTQWLDFSSLEISNLVGKNVLIVDEVDDTRTTLEYAVKELQKDVEAAAQKLEKAGKTRLCIFVLHVSFFFGLPSCPSLFPCSGDSKVRGGSMLIS